LNSSDYAKALIVQTMQLYRRSIVVAALLWAVCLQKGATGKRHPIPAPPPLGQDTAVAEIYAWCVFGSAPIHLTHTQ